MVQRSLGSYYSRYFKMPSIERRDLADIEKIILEELHPERYNLACSGFVYDRVKDIPSDPESAVTLVIYTHTPCLRLKFARSWAELYCEDNTPERNPIIERITKVVTDSERRSLWKFSKFAIWAAPTLGFGILCEVAILIDGGHLARQMLAPAIAFLLVTAVWWVIAYRATLFRFSHIQLGVKDLPPTENA